MPSRLSPSAVAGYAVAVLVVLALAGTSWDFMRRSADAQDFVSHTHEVMANVSAAEAALWRAESAQRAFIVTRDPFFVGERDAALEVVARHVQAVAALTRDNPAQQQRMEELRPLLQQRIAVYRRTQELAAQGGALDGSVRLEAGLQVMVRIQPVFAALSAEEQRLLVLREADEQRRLQETQRLFATLVLAILATVPLVLWQLRRELRARARAEADADLERHYSALHAQALTLYIGTTDKQAVVAGTLELLCAQPVFRAAALYAPPSAEAPAWQLTAARGLPQEVAARPPVETGPLGEALRQGRPVHVARHDASLPAALAAWLAEQRAGGLLLCPAASRGRTLGLLLLVLAAQPSRREMDFVEQLCAQLGIALHNLRQVRELGELAQRLREQGEELQRKNAALQAADRSKSEFLANMSHELRTPLNAVIGFAEVLADGLVGELNDEQREYVGEISGSGKHLLALINEVLDIAKIEAGQMSLELEPLRPAELAASGVSMLRERAVQQRVQLATEADPGLGALQADPRKARQILFNLLSNAVKFTPPGGQVLLSLARVPRRHVEQAHGGLHTRVLPPAPIAHEEYLEIAVRDSGIGIAPDQLERLFQPFTQIDSALNRQYTGTGLGLSLVLRLAQLHGGGVQVHSRPQQGSTFTVWLPWRPAEAGAPAGEAAAGAVPATAAEAPARVLVIDDDPSAVSLMRAQLQASGWQVEAAADARQGLQAAAALRPQAIVLDLLLPDADGWSVLAQLKRHEATRDIPVVVCSVIAEAQRGFALGASQVLTKPVSQQQLLDALGAAGRQAPRPGARVLVVDDDAAALQALCAALERAGLAPVPALGGQAALHEVGRRRPDLILLELGLGGVTGLDVVQALAGRPETADIPVIVLAEPTDDPQARDLLRRQVRGVMEKSAFSAEVLHTELRRALARHDAPAASLPSPQALPHSP